MFATAVIFGELTAGCGHTPRGGLPRGNVDLAITYGGAPVTAGYVELNNTQTGEGGGCELNQQGAATLKDIVAGNYVVTVNPPIPEFDPRPDPDAKAKDYPNLPSKYRKTASSPSPLHAEVQEGKTVNYKFDLKE